MIARLLSRWADPVLRRHNAQLRAALAAERDRAADMRSRAVAARRALAQMTADLRSLREGQ